MIHRSVSQLVATSIFALMAMSHVLPAVAVEEGSAAFVDRYIKDTLTKTAQLQTEELTSREKLGLRGDLLKGNGYWHMLRGQPSPAFSSFTFLNVNEPSAWTLSDHTQAKDVRTVKVSFSVAAYSPWLAEFQLQEVNGEWKITAFKDITRRPLPPNTSANDVLEAFLKSAMTSISARYDEKSKHKAAPGTASRAGSYWETSRNTTISGTGSGSAMGHLMGFRPDTWILEDFRQAGDFGETKATFSRTKTYRSGEQNTTFSTVFFEFTRVDGEWFIAAFRKADKPDSSDDSDKQKENPDSVNEESAITIFREDTSAASQLVQEQLNLLQGITPQTMNEANKKSKALWQDTREARQGLGRTIAMIMTVSGTSQGPLKWRIHDPEGDEKRMTVKAQIVSDENLAFKAIVFTVDQSNGIWLLSGAMVSM